MINFLVFLVFYGSVFFMSPSLRAFIYREDGLMEWVSAAAWAGACIVFFLGFKSALKSPRIIKSFWLACLCLVCFLAAGEEISWGQRAIGFDTPSAIGELNLQGEMNLHNLKWLDVRTEIGGGKKVGIERWLTFNRLGTLLWFGFLVALPLLFHFSTTIQNLSAWMGLPVAPVNIALAAITSYGVFFLLQAWSTFSFDPDSYSVFISPLNEAKETVIAVLFFCAALCCYRGIRKT